MALGLTFAIGNSICDSRKEIFLPGLALRPGAMQKESGNFSSHDKFICAISRCCGRRAACRGHDSVSFTSLEGAVEAIRRNDPRRDGRDIHRIWPAKGQPRPDCHRVDRRHGILYCGIGGSLGHSMDRSGCLCRSWSLGLCAPPRFKAFIRTLKARRHTLWKPSFCAVYDWVAAAALAVMWSLRV